MRRIVFDAAAADELYNQIDYLIRHHAPQAARALEARVYTFISEHLTIYPATGRELGHRGLWEYPIPRTKLVLWYRFTDGELQIVHVWHAAQDRDRPV